MENRERAMEGLGVIMGKYWRIYPYSGCKHIPTAFSGDSVAIVYCPSLDYMPVLNVSVKSLVASCAESNYYDIMILHRGIEKQDQRSIQMLADGKENISIRFFNTDGILTANEDSERYQPPMGLYRVYLPWILPDRDRVIILGVDTIVNSDLAELYCTPLVGVYAVGMFRELSEEYGNVRFRQYLDTDVSVLSLSAIREGFSPNYCDDFLIPKQQYHLDRIMLTDLFKDQIMPMDAEWNAAPENVPVSKTGKEVMCEIKILHYWGAHKPWCEPMMFLAEEWWQVARGTVFYEELLRRLCIQMPDTRSTIRKLVDRLLPKSSGRREFFKRFLSPLRFSKNR